MSFFLGINLGASALKLSLIDTPNMSAGAALGLRPTPRTWPREQDPADYTALQSGLSQLHTDLTSSGSRAIVFTGEPILPFYVTMRTNPCAWPLCGATNVRGASQPAS